MKEEQNKNIDKQKNETDWIEVLTKIWEGRKTIFICITVFFVFGLLHVVFSPKIYRSEITLVVETGSSLSTGNLSGLISQFSGLSGISVDKKGKDALSPELYGEVIQSKPFLLEIMKQKVTESKYDSTITVAEYLERHTSPSLGGAIVSFIVGLPGTVKGWMMKKEETSDIYIPVNEADSTADTAFYPIKLTKRESDIAEGLSGCIETDDDFKKTNKFIISVEMQDPLVVAQVTSYIVENLSKRIIRYRTKKAKTDLEFVSARTEDAEAKYIETQQALAIYKDRNKNVILSSVLSQEERLQAEYDLAYDMYKTLAGQLEQAKIKVQEETPVFNVVNPAQVPLKKSGPKSTQILPMMIFLGACFGVGMIYGKRYLRKIKMLFKKNSVVNE
jgi:capsule polysaccharide export protein KpsE/RkpR